MSTLSAHSPLSPISLSITSAQWGAICNTAARIASVDSYLFLSYSSLLTRSLDVDTPISNLISTCSLLPKSSSYNALLLFTLTTYLNSPSILYPGVLFFHSISAWMRTHFCDHSKSRTLVSSVRVSRSCIYSHTPFWTHLRPSPSPILSLLDPLSINLQLIRSPSPLLPLLHFLLNLLHFLLLPALFLLFHLSFFTDNLPISLSLLPVSIFAVWCSGSLIFESSLMKKSYTTPFSSSFIFSGFNFSAIYSSSASSCWYFKSLYYTYSSGNISSCCESFYPITTSLSADSLNLLLFTYPSCSDNAPVPSFCGTISPKIPSSCNINLSRAKFKNP